MTGCFGNLGPDFRHFPLWIDENGASNHPPGVLAVHLLKLPGAISLYHFLVWIGKQRDVDGLLLYELLVRLDGILAYAPNHSVQVYEIPL